MADISFESYKFPSDQEFEKIAKGYQKLLVNFKTGTLHPDYKKFLALADGFLGEAVIPENHPVVVQRWYALLELQGKKIPAMNIYGQFSGLNPGMMANFMRAVFKRRKKELSGSNGDDESNDMSAKIGSLMFFTFESQIRRFLEADGITCCKFDAIGVPCPYEKLYDAALESSSDSDSD